MRFSESVLVRAILLGFIQSHVPHAVHRVWPFSTPVLDRYVVDHAVDDIGCHLLCPFLGPCNQLDTEFGLVATTVQREGIKGSVAAVLLRFLSIVLACLLFYVAVYKAFLRK